MTSSSTAKAFSLERPHIDAVAPSGNLRLLPLNWVHPGAPVERADGEQLDILFGPGGFFPLDSDDIEDLIAAGQVWIPA